MEQLTKTRLRKSMPNFSLMEVNVNNDLMNNTDRYKLIGICCYLLALMFYLQNQNILWKNSTTRNNTLLDCLKCVSLKTISKYKIHDVCLKHCF